MSNAPLPGAQDGLLVREQLLAAGVHASAIGHRIHRGEWQRLLPRVYLPTSGVPTARQRLRAALLYAGPDAVLSHITAAQVSGLRVPDDRRVLHVTVPVARSPVRQRGVEIHRTSRSLPAVAVGGLPVTRAPRTIADAVPLLPPDDARALVGHALQTGRATLAQLLAELAAAPVHGSSRLRMVLQEASAGVRSPAESALRRLLSGSGLPSPVWNAPIPGTGYVVDALFVAARVIVEVDGARWHTAPGDWERDLQRQNRLHAAGYLVLRVPARRLRVDGAAVLREIRDTLAVRS